LTAAQRIKTPAQLCFLGKLYGGAFAARRIVGKLPKNKNLSQFFRENGTY